MSCTKTTHDVCTKMHDEVSYKVLNKVHDFLGILIRENLIKEAPFLDEEPMLMVSDLADDLYEVIHKGTLCNIEKGTDSHRQGNEYKPMTLDEAIAHAEESVNDTPCGQEHRQLADWLKELKEIKKSNTAKMCEALEAVVKVGYPHNFQHEAPHISGYCYEITTAIEKCFAALSAPARNCDRFANEDEASNAFIDWYNTVYDLKGDNWNEVSRCDLKHNVDGILHDFIKWLFAESKGEAK